MKKKLFIAGICLLAALAGIFLPTLFLSNRIHNVFDEVYYAFIQPLWPRYTFCDIRGMEVWYQEPTPQKDILYYDEPYLEIADGISVSYRKESEQLFFSFSKSLVDSETPATLRMVCLYTPASKELKYLNAMISVHSDYFPDYSFEFDEYMLVDISDARFVAPILEQNNVTREAIANYQHYILYERFLPDWFAVNSGPSKYSMDDWGEFTVVDETYRLLGEDWGK